MRKHHFAAIAASILFCAAFALATGVDKNPGQAIPAIILMAASAALFRYCERTGSAEVKSEEQTPSMGRTTNLKKVA